MSRSLPISVTFVALVAALTACAASPGSPDPPAVEHSEPRVSAECEKWMADGAAIKSGSAEYEIGMTTEACKSVDEWLTGLAEYPGLLAIATADDIIPEDDVSVVCYSYWGSPMCRDAKANGYEFEHGSIYPEGRVESTE